MNTFMARLERDLTQAKQLQDNTNKMLEHALHCIESACSMNTFCFSWEQKEQDVIMSCVPLSTGLVRRIPPPAKVLTVFPLASRPGQVRILFYLSTHTSHFDCADLDAVERHLCQGICQFLVQNKMVELVQLAQGNQHKEKE